MSDSPVHVVRALRALEAAYPTAHPDDRARIAAEIAKRGLVTIASDASVHFADDVAELAPRLATLPKGTDDASKARRAFLAEKRVEDALPAAPRPVTGKRALPADLDTAAQRMSDRSLGIKR